MRKRLTISILCLVLGIVALVFAMLVERNNAKELTRQTFDLSDEMILEQPYFEIIASALENRNLKEDIVSYNLGDGYIHLVLPENVSRRNVVVYYRDENGNYLARREYDFRGSVTIGDWQIVVDKPILPTLYFCTDDASDFDNMLASASKEEICYGSMRICVDKDMARRNGWFTQYVSEAESKSAAYTASLQGRGSSSWECDKKKSFTLRLEKSINILGMGAQKNWNLIGNAYDPSLLKNITFNNLSKKLGIKYQPKMQQVNLYVDGVYQGVYLITTKVKVSKNQVNLSKGDMLFRMDAPNPDQPILYESMTWFEDGNAYPVADLVYPENASEKNIEKAKEIIQRFINCVENPLNEDFDKFVDMDSLVKYYWIQEASMNFDAWQRSVYLYYVEREDKMYLGPVWDMDLTLGSPYEKAYMTFDEPEGMRICNAGWYTKLFQRQEFARAVIDYYKNKGVREALYESVEDFYKEKEKLSSDGYLNYVFFGHSNMGTTINYGDSYDEYCDNMINFYKERLDYIDSWMEMMLVN